MKEEIVPILYRVSIKDGDVGTFIAAGWIKAHFIEEITKRQIHKRVKEQCKRKVNGNSYIYYSKPSKLCICNCT